MSTNLKLERNRLNLKQDDVVNALGIGKATYVRWESGNPIPSDKLKVLSELGFDITFIVTGKRIENDNVLLERAVGIVAKYVSRSGRPLTHPELFYPVAYEIYEILLTCKEEEKEVDPYELGSKVISLFAA